MDAETSRPAHVAATRAARIPARRIRLRELTAADLPTIFGYQCDGEANELAAVVPRSWEEFEVHWLKVLANGDITPRAILLDEELVGQVTCFPRDGKSWVGYWIDREYWGRGVATQGLALLVEEVNTRPLVACVAIHNIGSLRVLERCGFAEVERRMCPGDERYLACEEVILKLD
jgi:RimJ/RimL family protein N-acetyltransferase